MIVGYLRIVGSLAEYENEIAAFEGAGCKHVFFDYGREAHGATLEALLNNLGAGDVLLVWSLDSVARSLSGLATLLAKLGKAELASLADGFDSRRETSVSGLLRQLKDFEEVAPSHSGVRNGSAGRVGRPRALSDESVRLAWSLLAQGKSRKAVATQLGVSRATLIRYLAECKTLPSDAHDGGPLHKISEKRSVSVARARAG